MPPPLVYRRDRSGMVHRMPQPDRVQLLTNIARAHAVEVRERGEPLVSERWRAVDEMLRSLAAGQLKLAEAVEALAAEVRR